MAGELQAGLGLLSGLLALPKTWEDERNRALFQNALLQKLATPDPSSPDAAAMAQTPVPQLPVPGHFPGTQVPFLGGLLRGVGSVGQGLNLALGGQAPQTFDPQLLGMMLMQQRFQGTRALGEERLAATKAGQQERTEETIRHDKEMEALKKSAEDEAIRRDKELDAIRAQGKQPSDPAVARFMQLNPNASPDEIAAFEAKTKGAEAKPAGSVQGLYIEQGRKLGLTGQALIDYVQKQQAQGISTTGAARALAAQVGITSPTRTMSETAPKVIFLADKVQKQLDSITTGPLASRYQELLSGKGGVANPDFTRYRTDVGLLQTLLMRMHVGARGGQMMMGHFENLLNYAVQSPENMRAALEEVRDYAQDVAGQPGALAPGPSGGAPAPGETPGQGPVHMTPPPGGLPVPSGVPDDQDPIRRALKMPGYQ